MTTIEMINSFNSDALEAALKMIDCITEEMGKGNNKICSELSHTIKQRFKYISNEAEIVIAKVSEKLERDPDDLEEEFDDIIYLNFRSSFQPVVAFWNH